MAPHSFKRLTKLLLASSLPYEITFCMSFAVLKLQILRVNSTIYKCKMKILLAFSSMFMTFKVIQYDIYSLHMFQGE